MPYNPTQSTAVSPEALALAKALVGVPLRRNQHNSLVSTPSVKRWARSIGDRNPLWLDAEYAATSSQGRVVAPPCWLYSVDNTCLFAKFPDCHVIYGGCDWEFYRRLAEGDTVSAHSKLTGVEEKTGRFCGQMVLQTGETLFTGAGGEPVAKAVSYVLRTRRPQAVEAGKYRDWKKHILTPAEAVATEDGYDNEEIRGSQTRFWEDLVQEESLTPIVRGPLTSEEVIQFLGATSPSRGFKHFLRYRQRHTEAAFLDEDTGSWESWEASLLRDDVAQAFGFPFAHDSGIDRISWLGNLLTNWMGDQGTLEALSVRLTLPNVYGDVTWCRGKVTRKYQQHGQGMCDLEVWCDNQRGQKSALGTATVALPSKA
ncbi:MAG: hypothetical protein BZY87_04075 [SAR202 cluster bacterium Io17-Chloro-G6]|nr:MAG: hypothetical protein BZY87_04075 [SAR202 cluster bacterium Io17-Chloro-G6]